MSVEPRFLTRFVAAMPELQHGKVVWLSWSFMFARLFVGLALLTVLGWRLVHADMVPDLLAVRSAAPAGRSWTRAGSSRQH